MTIKPSRIARLNHSPLVHRLKQVKAGADQSLAYEADLALLILRQRFAEVWQSK